MGLKARSSLKLTHMPCPSNISLVAHIVPNWWMGNCPILTGKDHAKTADLYEDFFRSKGKWTKSRTWHNLVHKSRSKRSLKKVWRTLKQLKKQSLAYLILLFCATHET